MNKIGSSLTRGIKGDGGAIKIAKIIGYSLTAAIVLFVITLVSVGYRLRNLGSAQVLYSDSTPEKWDADEQRKMRLWAESEIEEIFGGISIDDVNDLYFGSGGWCILITSFRMESQEECESLFKKKGLELQDFQKGNFAVDGPWERYYLPHEWEKRHPDSNWPLKEGDGFLCYGDKRKLILYTPEDNRIYIMIDHWGG